MSYTTEIRARVLAYTEDDGLIKTVCNIFRVSRSSIQRWRLRKAVVGLLETALMLFQSIQNTRVFPHDAVRKKNTICELALKLSIFS